MTSESVIQQGNTPVMPPLAAREIHIPPSRHTDLSLAGWTRISFVSRVAGQKNFLALSNAVAKNKLIEPQIFTYKCV